mmetsp:Transcript_104168/g.301362  ORF Transcript_104168/g.301362 Transcript_104168/m.301362 type:complete len:228 (-) Transcript_104168:355-1038(-)
MRIATKRGPQAKMFMPLAKSSNKQARGHAPSASQSNGSMYRLNKAGSIAMRSTAAKNVPTDLQIVTPQEPKNTALKSCSLNTSTRTLGGDKVNIAWTWLNITRSNCSCSRSGLFSKSATSSRSSLEAPLGERSGDDLPRPPSPSVTTSARTCLTSSSSSQIFARSLRSSSEHARLSLLPPARRPPFASARPARTSRISFANCSATWAFASATSRRCASRSDLRAAMS